MSSFAVPYSADPATIPPTFLPDLIESHPSLTTPFRPFDRAWLGADKRRYLEALDACHVPATVVDRITHCARFGSVVERCLLGDVAIAFRHVCGSPGCTYCGAASNMLRRWLRRRGPEVRSTPQLGIELMGPRGAAIEDAARRLARSLHRDGMSSVRRRVVTPDATNESVRMVVNIPRMSYAELMARVRALGDGWSFRFHHGEPMEVLRWMFAATDAMLAAPPTVRAALFAAVRGHLLKSCGDFYRPVPRSEQAPAGDEDDDGTAITGHVCQTHRLRLEVIPPAHQHVQGVDEIHSQYEYVSWSSAYDPFRISRIGAYTDNLTASQGESAVEVIPEGSPPV